MLYFNTSSYTIEKRYERSLVKMIGRNSPQVAVKMLPWKLLPFYSKLLHMYINDNGVLHSLFYVNNMDTAIFNTKYKNYIVFDKYIDIVIADGDTILCIKHGDDNIIESVSHYDFATGVIASFGCVLYKTNVCEHNFLKCNTSQFNLGSNVTLKLKYSKTVNPEIYKKMCYRASIIDTMHYISALNDTFVDIDRLLPDRIDSYNIIARYGDFVIIDAVELFLKKTQHIILIYNSNRKVPRTLRNYYCAMVSVVGRRMYFTSHNDALNDIFDGSDYLYEEYTYIEL